MRALLAVSWIALGCSGAAKPVPVVASGPTCALPVSFGNQSAYPSRSLESRAVTSAHGALLRQGACGRAYRLAFSLDATEDAGTAVKAKLHMSVISKAGALLGESSVTITVPKPVSDDDMARAVATAADAMAEKVATTFR
jgi:hypothetical protein